MGWTSYAAYCSPKIREEEHADIERLYTSLVESAPYTAECLMASKVGRVWYLAVRLTPKPGVPLAEPPMRGHVPDATGAIVYAGVVLTSRQDGEWGYKDLCESMGPYEASAPLKLLDLLSPLDRRCCRTRFGNDSPGGFKCLHGPHDDASMHLLPHDELVQLQRCAEEARLAADLAGPRDDLARAA